MHERFAMFRFARGEGKPTVSHHQRRNAMPAR
jgi:hypothetical protein